LNQDTIHQYTLWKTQVPNLQKFNKHFNKSLQRANSDGENGDISEMYTGLDHGSLIASVEWLLDKHFYRRWGVYPLFTSSRSGIRRICSQKQLGRILFQRHVQTVLGHAPLNGTWRANRK
jgi:hypothetical protein